MPEEQIDIAIVGGGAAGLMAAICGGRAAIADERPLRVVVFDGARRLGAKILIAGGGRCNVTHDVVEPDDFHGSSRNSIARILRTFTVADTIGFFRDIGVELKREEGGKLFPVTDRARTVLDALLWAVGKAGAEVRTEEKVVGIALEGGRMRVDTSVSAYLARSVILASGGKSVPKTGSDGSGYRIASTLGHTVNDPFAALVPLVLPKNEFLTRLAGVSAHVELSVLSHSGRLIARESGAMLCTHFGLSGPAVLNISRHLVAAGKQEAPARLVVRFFPGLEFEDADRWLIAASTDRPRATISTLLKSRLPERLAADLAIHGAGVDPSGRSGKLSRTERRRLAHALTQLEVPVVGDRGFDYAEVTAGGIPLSQIDPRTMSSRRCRGLYLCGEILDVDGRIGGYNFQWAWSSGRLAGVSAVAALEV